MLCLSDAARRQLAPSPVSLCGLQGPHHRCKPDAFQALCCHDCPLHDSLQSSAGADCQPYLLERDRFSFTGKQRACTATACMPLGAWCLLVSNGMKRTAAQARQLWGSCTWPAWRRLRRLTARGTALWQPSAPACRRAAASHALCFKADESAVMHTTTACRPGGWSQQMSSPDSFQAYCTCLVVRVPAH